jgi:hypothetical protein
MSDQPAKPTNITAILGGLAVIVLLAVGVWAFDASQVTSGSGSSDLEVEFLVVEAGSGRPIANAAVEVFRFGGRQVTAHRTNDVGKVRLPFQDCAVDTRRSRLGLTNTRNVHPPELYLRASAVGYEQTKWELLGADFDRGTKSVEVGGKDRFPVRFEMKKAAAEK